MVLLGDVQYGRYEASSTHRSRACRTAWRTDAVMCAPMLVCRPANASPGKLSGQAMTMQSVPVPTILPSARRAPKPAATEMAFGDGEMELVAFLSEDPWIAKRDLALFLLMGEVGLKLGEALALDRPAIPTRTRPILTVPPFAGKPERLVPVTADMVDVIADYLSLCPFDIPEDGPLFVGLRGRRLNPGVIQRQMRRLRIHLGLPSSATPTMLRKQLALRLRAEGAGTREVQQRLGYAHTSSTLRAAPANSRGGGKGRG